MQQDENEEENDECPGVWRTHSNVDASQQPHVNAVSHSGSHENVIPQRPIHSHRENGAVGRERVLKHATTEI